MIDVGGPAMLRAAAKNYVHVAPVCRPGPVRRRAGRATRRTASSRSIRVAACRRGVRDYGGVRVGDRGVVRGRPDEPAHGHADVREGGRPRRTARTRTSARPSTRRRERAATSSPASISCKVTISPSTTSPTCPRPGRSGRSSPCPRASSSSTRTRAASRSARRSARHTRARSPPIPSPRTEGWSSATGPIDGALGGRLPSSSSKCSSPPASTTTHAPLGDEAGHARAARRRAAPGLTRASATTGASWAGC